MWRTTNPHRIIEVTQEKEESREPRTRSNKRRFAYIFFFLCKNIRDVWNRLERKPHKGESSESYSVAILQQALWRNRFTKTIPPQGPLWRNGFTKTIPPQLISIAMPLQCGRPERSGLLVLKLLFQASHFLNRFYYFISWQTSADHAKKCGCGRV